MKCCRYCFQQLGLVVHSECSGGEKEIRTTGKMRVREKEVLPLTCDKVGGENDDEKHIWS